ncbi:MAG: hypothetical protein K0Q56_1743 [Sporolactobacillus laevolacticus]|jgi:DNA-binding PadR family transcriptional regulator|nr:hypothetical protein [Sporolactobacillus laevolacticus]
MKRGGPIRSYILREYLDSMILRLLKEEDSYGYAFSK